jgi:hypothetical protein
MLDGRVMTADLAVVTEPSPLDDLRELYRSDQQRKPLDLAIPASHGRLVVRYGAPSDRSQLSAVFRAVQSGGVLDDYADVDLVVDCAKDILRAQGVIRDAATLLMAGMDGMAYVRADPVERAVMREIHRIIEQRLDPGPAES